MLSRENPSSSAAASVWSWPSAASTAPWACPLALGEATATLPTVSAARGMADAITSAGAFHPDVRRGRQIAAAATRRATPSSAAEALSTNEASSVTPECGPKGAPQIRVAAQAPTNRAEVASTVTSIQRRGRRIRPTPSPNCTHAVTTKATPSAAHSDMWPGTIARWMAAAPNRQAASR